MRDHWGCGFQDRQSRRGAGLAIPQPRCCYRAAGLSWPRSGWEGQGQPVPMPAARWRLWSGLCAGAGDTRSPETWRSSRLSGPLPALAPLQANGLSHGEYKCVIPALGLSAAAPTAGRHCPSLARLPVPVQGAASGCLPGPMAGGRCPEKGSTCGGSKALPSTWPSWRQLWCSCKVGAFRSRMGC